VFLEVNMLLRFESLFACNYCLITVSLSFIECFCCLFVYSLSKALLFDYSFVVFH